MKHVLAPNMFSPCYFIPNRTFLVRFAIGGILGEFGRAMVRILERPNEPDMPPKRTKKARLGIYRTQIFCPKFSVTVIKSARRYTEWLLEGE